MNKTKHLEFLQAIITRMNSNSFLLKGWTVTLISALFAFAAKETNIKYVFISFIGIPVFWILDAYFLSQERQYRSLYDVVREEAEDNKIDFSLDARPFNKGRNTWSSALFSVTLLIFYLALAFITWGVKYLIN